MIHFDSFMIKINELYIIKLLQYKMAGIIIDIYTVMISSCLQKRFKSQTIMEIFTRM